jgi:voltage-gated potassium channel
MLVVFAIGSLGYYALGHGNIALLTCMYMTAVTLSTVGYGEVVPVQGIADREVFTMALLFVGMGTIAYFVTTLAAFILEGDLLDIVRRRRMQSSLQRLSGHYVVLGAGRSGRVVAAELIQRQLEVVVVDRNDAALHVLGEQLGYRLHPVAGDATDDQTLNAVGLERAAGMAACLTEDRDNLYVTFSARQINPGLRIVSKVMSDPRKLLRAGANATVAINEIGGHQIANELVRPRVTNFIDGLLMDRGQLRLEEMVVSGGSTLCGHSLATAKLRERANVLVVAARAQGDAEFTYNPGPDLALIAETVLVVMGPREEVAKLEKLLA